MLSDPQIRQALQTYKTIAVIGLSPDPARASFGVTQYMIHHGYEIWGIRPGTAEIMGRPCYSSLKDLPQTPDILDVFRASEAVAGIVEEIAQLPTARRPKMLWLQEGVQDATAEKKAEELGLLVVSNRCILKEHRRLL